MGKHVTTDSYRKDPLYQRITKAVAAVLTSGNVVSPVDVLIRMDLLKPEQLKDWRHGRIPYQDALNDREVTESDWDSNFTFVFEGHMGRCPSFSPRNRHGR